MRETREWSVSTVVVIASLGAMAVLWGSASKSEPADPRPTSLQARPDWDRVFDADGNHLGTIKPDEVPANVAWGDDGSTLYMTARTGLYRIRLSTRGNIL